MNYQKNTSFSPNELTLPNKSSRPKSCIHRLLYLFYHRHHEAIGRSTLVVKPLYTFPLMLVIVLAQPFHNSHVFII